MVVSSLGVILTVLVVTIHVQACYKIMKYKKEVDEKNMQLMQFYLDSRFMNKALVDSLKFSHSINFCKDLIEKIKDYYHLEEIIIIDSVTNIVEINKNINKDINILFTKEDIAPILHELMGHEVKEFNMKIKEQEYVLHISKLSSIEKSDGVIICVELAPFIVE